MERTITSCVPVSIPGNQISNTIFSNGNSSTGTAIPWAYQYDAFGDQIESDDRDGHVIDSTYDSLGRKLSDTWVGGGYSSTYTYNALSEPVSAGDNSSQYTCKYNDQQYLQTQTVSYTGLSQTFTMTDGYNDLQGVRTSLTATDSASPSSPVFSNSYTPDGLGRYTQISQTGAGLTSLTVNMQYTTDGQLVNVQRSQTTGSNTTQMAASAYTYYNDGLLDDLSESQSSLQDIRADQYQYTTAGLTAYQFSFSPVNTTISAPTADPANVDNDYLYNASGQLTTTTNNWTSAVTTKNYGANGNPAPAPGTVVGANNELQQDANGVYGYDDQGNLTEQWSQAAVQIPQSNGTTGVQIPQSGNGYYASGMSMSSNGVYEVDLQNVLVEWSGTVAADLSLSDHHRDQRLELRPAGNVHRAGHVCGRKQFEPKRPAEFLFQPAGGLSYQCEHGLRRKPEPSRGFAVHDLAELRLGFPQSDHRHRRLQVRLSQPPDRG